MAENLLQGGNGLVPSGKDQEIDPRFSLVLEPRERTRSVVDPICNVWAIYRERNNQIFYRESRMNG